MTQPPAAATQINVACISVHPLPGTLSVIRLAVTGIVAWGIYTAHDDAVPQTFIVTQTDRWELNETLAELDALLGSTGEPVT